MFEELLGSCDTCKTDYYVSGQYDHCSECGNCWKCCLEAREHTRLIVEGYGGGRIELKMLREVVYREKGWISEA